MAAEKDTDKDKRPEPPEKVDNPLVRCNRLCRIVPQRLLLIHRSTAPPLTVDTQPALALAMKSLGDMQVRPAASCPAVRYCRRRTHWYGDQRTRY